MNSSQLSTDRGDTSYVETVIIGAGQAGLSTGYHLQRRRREFIILEGNDRVGDGWRRQWDTLRLYTPAKYDGLPGMPFPGSPWTYPLKDEVADYLEAYANRFGLPIRTGVRVERVEPAEGGYLVHTDDGRRIETGNVVIATGTFGRTPSVPDFAAELAPEIRQLHSSEYRRPDQLQDGPVLVVGASHSGTDVAFEVAPFHQTILSGPDRGQIPIRLDAPMARFVIPVLIFVARHLITRRTPIGRREMDEIRFHGGPMIRVTREHLEQRNVQRLQSRVVDVSNGAPVLDDGQVLDVTNVVWCTGFRQVYDWLEVPVIGADGWPQEYRGVAEGAPGLFFCGLAFQYAFSSMMMAGVGRDAAFVAEKIAVRSRAVTRALSRADAT